MALGALLREHSDAVEADLQRYYQIDLADLWRGGLNVRRLSVLIQFLPSDSAVAAAVTGMPREWNSVIPWLLEYVIQGLTGEPYPGRPGAATTADKRESRTAALLDHKRRMAEREAELAQD